MNNPFQTQNSDDPDFIDTTCTQNSIKSYPLTGYSSMFSQLSSIEIGTQNSNYSQSEQPLRRSERIAKQPPINYSKQ